MNNFVTPLSRFLPTLAAAASSRNPWPRSIREVSDVTAVIVEECISGNTPVAGQALANSLDVELMEELFEGKCEEYYCCGRHAWCKDGDCNVSPSPPSNVHLQIKKE